MKKLDFAAAVRHVIVDHHISHAELADRLGMTRQQFSDILNRREDYRLNADVIRIADALGLDVILTLTDRETGQRYDVK